MLQRQTDFKVHREAIKRGSWGPAGVWNQGLRTLAPDRTRRALATITLSLPAPRVYKSLLAGSWEAAARDSSALEHRKPPFNPPAVVCLSKNVTKEQM